ncbi:MAG: hypothetical protein ACRDPQ_02740 [Nocardioidaceae bacterium]
MNTSSPIDELRALVAEESRLRAEIGLPPGPSFHERLVGPAPGDPNLELDLLLAEEATLRAELGHKPREDTP